MNITKLTDREIRWLQFLNVHGPVNSFYLYELTKGTHRCPWSASEQILKLWRGGYIFRPAQQRHAINEHYNSYVYDIDERGINRLEALGLYVQPKRRSNFWEHDYFCSCITASLEIAAVEAGFEYINRATILDRNQATIGYEIDGKDLVMDDLCGFKHPDWERPAFWSVEAYRSTFAGRSSGGRKDYDTTIARYARYIGGKLYKQHLGLRNARLGNLSVFNDMSQERKYRRIIQENMGECAYLLSTTVLNFGDDWRPPKQVWRHLFTDPWERVGQGSFYLNV